MTEGEKLFQELWTKRNGCQFYPQIVVLGYVVDFYSFKLKLAVEVDGGYHLPVSQREKDEYRDQVLTKHGIKTVRIETTTDKAEMLRQIEKVKHTVWNLRRRKRRKPRPPPSINNPRLPAMGATG